MIWQFSTPPNLDVYKSLQRHSWAFWVGNLTKIINMGLNVNTDRAFKLFVMYYIYGHVCAILGVANG